MRGGNRLRRVADGADGNRHDRIPSGPFPAPPPFPAPVSQTLTGTWFVGDRRVMTVTQNGTSVTGMPAPVIFDAGNGVIVSESGLISGAVDGDNVMLAITDLITVSGMATGGVCRAARTFKGTLIGNTLSGTMTAGTMPLTCAPGIELPDIELPDMNGPVMYTRQVEAASFSPGAASFLPVMHRHYCDDNEVNGSREAGSSARKSAGGSLEGATGGVFKRARAKRREGLRRQGAL